MGLFGHFWWFKKFNQTIMNMLWKFVSNAGSELGPMAAIPTVYMLGGATVLALQAPLLMPGEGAMHLLKSHWENPIADCENKAP